MRLRRFLPPSLAALALLTAAAPAVRAADATLYEVTENTKYRGHKLVRRLATAALQGTVNPGTPLCPASAPAPCDITVVASDNLSLETGVGSARGTFAVVVNEPNTVDAAEVVVLQGELAGTIDLSGAPLGTMDGRWTARGLGSGRFTGVFRLPVDLVPGVPVYVLDLATLPEAGSFVPVQDAERALGSPTVRLEITFQ